MGRITADESMVQTLTGVTEPVDVCDGSGKVLGRYFPDSAAESDDELARRLFDFEEIKRRKAASTGKGRTLAEVWARIDAMERPS